MYRTPPGQRSVQFGDVHYPPLREQGDSSSNHSSTNVLEELSMNTRDVSSSANVSQRQRSKMPAVQSESEEDDPGVGPAPPAYEPSASPPPTQAELQATALRAQNTDLVQQLQEVSERMERLEREHTIRNSVERPGGSSRTFTMPASTPVPSRQAASVPPRQQRATTFDSAISDGFSGYRPKVTDLHNKLSDGTTIKASLWKALMYERLEIYAYALPTDGFRRQYVLEQTQGVALDYLEGLYMQQNPPLSATELVDQVASFLTDSAEQQRARDDYYMLRMGSLAFSEFHRQLMLLATTAGITDKETLRRDLTSKVTEFYRRHTAPGRMASTTLERDVEVYQYIEANESGIRTVNSTRSAPPASTPRSRRGNTHYASKQELSTQARQTSYAPASQRPTVPVAPNTPRHFTPLRTTPTFQQGGYQRNSTPSGNHYGDRARSHTPHTVADMDYPEQEEDQESYADAQEDLTPEQEAEAQAHAVHEEMNRAKDDA